MFTIWTVSFLSTQYRVGHILYWEHAVGSVNFSFVTASPEARRPGPEIWPQGQFVQSTVNSIKAMKMDSPAL